MILSMREKNENIVHYKPLRAGNSGQAGSTAQPPGLPGRHWAVRRGLLLRLIVKSGGRAGCRILLLFDFTWN